MELARCAGASDQARAARRPRRRLVACVRAPRRSGAVSETAAQPAHVSHQASNETERLAPSGRRRQFDEGPIWGEAVGRDETAAGAALERGDERRARHTRRLAASVHAGERRHQRGQRTCRRRLVAPETEERPRRRVAAAVVADLVEIDAREEPAQRGALRRAVEAPRTSSRSARRRGRAAACRPRRAGGSRSCC